MTKGDLLEAWGAHLADNRRRSPHTVRAYLATAARLLDALGDADWAALSAIDATTLRGQLARRRADGIGNVSAARELSALKAFISFARGGYVADSVGPSAGELAAQRGRVDGG